MIRIHWEELKVLGMITDLSQKGGGDVEERVRGKK